MIVFAAISHAEPTSLSKVQLLDEECFREFSLRGKVTGLRGNARAALLLHYKDDANCLTAEFTSSSVVVMKTKAGRSTQLTRGSFESPSDGSLIFTIKRRLWRISVICASRIVARAYDTEMSGGAAGWRGTGGAKIEELRLQERGPLFFTDDFTRAASDSSLWTVHAGRCKVAEVEIGAHAGAVGRHSSNAFSWEVHAQPLALCSVGHWFWDDYSVEACVQPQEQTPATTGSGTVANNRGSFGIAAYVQDARNYLLFRWSAALPGKPTSGVREILRVKDGKYHVLASQPGGYQPNQWYHVRFIVRDGFLSGYIDGKQVCSARDDAFGQGKVGLYAENCSTLTFDDVRIAGTDGFRETFEQPEPGKWEDSGSVWQTRPQVHARCMVQAGEGVTVSGRPDWDRFVFAANVTPENAQEVGLAFAYRGPRQYYFFAIPAHTAGKAQLVQVNGGSGVIVAESTALFSASNKARLKLDVDRGSIKAFVNDHLALQTFDPLCRPGRVGFYAKGGPGVRFGDMVVWLRAEEPTKPRIDEQFTKEDSMAGWATAGGSWRAGNDRILWHVGDFYGYPRVRVELPSARAAWNGTLILNADGTNAESGYQLLTQITPAGEAKLTLKRRNEVVATKSGVWRVDSDNRMLRLWRDGELVVGALGDDVAILFRDAKPLTGTRVGVTRTDGDLPLASLDASTDNLLDCTFSGPPVQWWSGRGVWDVAQRWPCDDRWSFFGGLNSESPMLWTKQSFAGDITVEAWMALYMDNIDDPVVGYRHPADLNLSFCANGKDVSSGYSFMFAAANNTETRIMRRDQIVARTSQVRMINPVRTNLAFQRHWFYLRAEKRGNQIRFFVDDQPAGQYTDPIPITEGQVALWTWRNGLMVARARIWYERDGGYMPVPVPEIIAATFTASKWSISSTPPVSLVSDFESGTDTWTTESSPEAPILTLDRNSPGQGQRSLRVVNRVSGGDMTVWCGVRQFDARKFPALQFLYRSTSFAKVNLYMRVRNRWLVVGFTAPAQPGEGVTYLGAFEEVTPDGRWHTARFDLLSALQRIFPGESSLLVEDLCFASPRVEYLRSGFGGNYWGTEYSIDDFRLIGTSTTTAEDAKMVVMRTGPGIVR